MSVERGRTVSFVLMIETEARTDVFPTIENAGMEKKALGYQFNYDDPP